MTTPPDPPPDLAALKGCVAALMDGHMECVLPRACYEDWKALLAAAPWLLARAEAGAEYARVALENAQEVSRLLAAEHAAKVIRATAERERDAARAAWRETNAHLDQAIEDRDDARDAFDAAREEVARLRGAARALLDLRAEVPATYEDAYEFTFKGWGREKWEALAALAPPPEGEEG